MNALVVGALLLPVLIFLVLKVDKKIIGILDEEEAYQKRLKEDF